MTTSLKVSVNGDYDLTIKQITKETIDDTVSSKKIVKTTTETQIIQGDSRVSPPKEHTLYFKHGMVNTFKIEEEYRGGPPVEDTEDE